MSQKTKSNKAKASKRSNAKSSYRPSPKRKKGSRQKVSMNRGSSTKVWAPSSISRNIVTTKANGNSRFTKREFITNASVSQSNKLWKVKKSDGFVNSLFSFVVNAGLSTFFPWLAGVGNAFEQYVFKKLNLHYVPSVGTGAVGNVIMSPLYDVSSHSDTIEDKQVYLNRAGAVRGTLWNEVVCSLDPKMLYRLLKSHFVRKTDLKHDEDPKMYDAAIIDVVVESEASNSTSEVGEIWLDYDVELFIPKPVYEPEILGPSCIVSGHTHCTPLNNWVPWGNDNVITHAGDSSQLDVSVGGGVSNPGKVAFLSQNSYYKMVVSITGPFELSGIYIPRYNSPTFHGLEACFCEDVFFEVQPDSTRNSTGQWRATFRVYCATGAGLSPYMLFDWVKPTGFTIEVQTIESFWKIDFDAMTKKDFDSIQTLFKTNKSKLKV